MRDLGWGEGCNREARAGWVYLFRAGWETSRDELVGGHDAEKFRSLDIWNRVFEFWLCHDSTEHCDTFNLEHPAILARICQSRRDRDRDSLTKRTPCHFCTISSTDHGYFISSQIGREASTTNVFAGLVKERCRIRLRSERTGFRQLRRDEPSTILNSIWKYGVRGFSSSCISLTTKEEGKIEGGSLGR